MNYQLSWHDLREAAHQCSWLVPTRSITYKNVIYVPTDGPVLEWNVLIPKPLRAVVSSVPMQVGCVPLHVPSAWQTLRGDPTRMKGDLHWKKTSDL